MSECVDVAEMESTKIERSPRSSESESEWRLNFVWKKVVFLATAKRMITPAVRYTPIRIDKVKVSLIFHF